MRRLLIVGALAVMSFGTTGCILNRYSPDPTIRTDQLMNESENLRQAGAEMRRFWMNDMPSHLTPERVNGGIFPG